SLPGGEELPRPRSHTARRRTPDLRIVIERARRIVSLLPSATEIVCALGLEDRLVGVSHSCDYPPHVRTNPVLTRPRFPLDGLSSGEIDAAVRQALREFGSVYEVDGAGLAAARPDLLLTQGVCEVCAVPTRDAQAAAAGIATSSSSCRADSTSPPPAPTRTATPRRCARRRRGPSAPDVPMPSTPRPTSAVPGRASRTAWSCSPGCCIRRRSPAYRSRAGPARWEADVSRPQDVLVAWSGGKDSALALREIVHDGRYRVAALLTTVT